MIRILVSSWCFNGIDDDLFEHALDVFVVIMLFDILNQLVVRDGFVKGFDIRSDDVFWFLIQKYLSNTLRGNPYASWALKMVTIGVHHVGEGRFQLFE